MFTTTCLARVQMRIFAILGCAFLLGACGTPSAKVFKAPSSAKVNAATADLNVKVQKARETFAKAKKAAEEAKVIHARMLAQALSVKELLTKFEGTLPDQYKGPLREITVQVDGLIGENEALRQKLNELLAWNKQLEDQLRAAEIARVDLQKAQDDYAGAAAGLANEATLADEKRYKAESQLVKEKWTRILWRIGGGFAVAAIIGFLALWLLGKLGWAGAKIASKFP